MQADSYMHILILTSGWLLFGILVVEDAIKFGDIYGNVYTLNIMLKINEHWTQQRVRYGHAHNCMSHDI